MSVEHLNLEPKIVSACLTGKVVNVCIRKSQPVTGQIGFLFMMHFTNSERFFSNFYGIMITMILIEMMVIFEFLNSI